MTSYKRKEFCKWTTSEAYRYTLVVPYESSDVIKFAQGCLNDRTVLSVLDPSVIVEIKKAIEQHASLFPTEDDKHLVHGDFNPANILLDQINGSWVVTGILDWEFAFSGSYLGDVANMLRYVRKEQSIPEIMDLNVLASFRKICIGSLLLERKKGQQLNQIQ